jgi:hypothetical protein
MWPVSRREAILRFAPNSAETSRNRGHAPLADDNFPRVAEKGPDAVLTAPGHFATASSQPEGLEHGCDAH